MVSSDQQQWATGSKPKAKAKTKACRQLLSCHWCLDRPPHTHMSARLWLWIFIFLRQRQKWRIIDKIKCNCSRQGQGLGHAAGYDWLSLYCRRTRCSEGEDASARPWMPLIKCNGLAARHSQLKMASLSFLACKTFSRNCWANTE